MTLKCPTPRPDMVIHYARCVDQTPQALVPLRTETPRQRDRQAERERETSRERERGREGEGEGRGGRGRERPEWFASLPDGVIIH